MKEEEVKNLVRDLETYRNFFREEYLKRKIDFNENVFIRETKNFIKASKSLEINRKKLGQIRKDFDSFKKELRKETQKNYEILHKELLKIIREFKK